MSTAYVISPITFVLRDAPSEPYQTNADFHVKNGDYLLYLATIIGFAEEILATCSNSSSKDVAFLRKVREDVQRVNKSYKLTKK